ncbi:helix-turn-helix domain-containing protein [Salinisphaera hydrothermalis]|uniref:helix-turn-helix domain-containing protein n=1 Tax=Salinisphaera hydrothermalis TaxID=563188 RepID=UPI0033425245
MSTTTPRKKARPGDWHPADIKAALEKSGWSLRRLGQHHGLSGSALKNALHRCYPRAEYLIGEAIGVPAHEIWPTRYHANGMPKRGNWTPPHCTHASCREESALSA